MRSRRSLRPTTLGRTFVAVVRVAVVVFGACGAAAAADRCTAVRVPTDSQDVVCRLDDGASGRPLRFVATFGGSHDDTRLTLDARLGGEPLVCGAGSRTSLFAEDGIVQLDCRFRIVVERGATPALEVRLTVHHAQFVSASVEAD